MIIDSIESQLFTACDPESGRQICPEGSKQLVPFFLGFSNLLLVFIIFDKRFVGVWQ
jgi:hypothetical protein